MAWNRRRVAIVGGGIAGLTAAWQLARRAGDELDVVVLEGSPQVGGKLRVSDVEGVPVDEGAESMLARRPEGVELVRELDLAEQLVEPGVSGASIWLAEGMAPIPRGQVMGVPSDLDAFAESGLLSAAGLRELRGDERTPAPPLAADVTVGEYVTARLGGELVDRLVEPLLGGVYAGRADVLSLRATLPQLAPALSRDGSLVAAARHVVENAPASGGPVFLSLRNGMGSLPETLAKRSGAEVRTEAMVRALRRDTTGWSLTVGPARAPEEIRADAVVVAVPARPASRLLADVVPGAAGALASIEYASMALVTFAYPCSAFPAGGPSGTGFLVPASTGRTMKAATFVSAKWPHVTAPDRFFVRCSVGRHGEERSLQVSDQQLADAVAAELREAAALTAPPLAARVTRWGGALPQYAVGHLDRVSRITEAVEGTDRLAVCGAAYEGVGIPACIATGRKAADRILSELGRE